MWSSDYLNLLLVQETGYLHVLFGLQGAVDNYAMSLNCDVGTILLKG